MKLTKELREELLEELYAAQCREFLVHQVIQANRKEYTYKTYHVEIFLLEQKIDTIKNALIEDEMDVNDYH